MSRPALMALACMAVLALGAEGAPRALGPPGEQPVFPPDPEAEAARDKLLAQVRVPEPGEERLPNVVLILTDDLGYVDTGVYGSKSIPTPRIDALAEEGVWMTDAYAAAPACSPSRAGLLTGRYPQRYGFEFNTGGTRFSDRLHTGLDPREVTLADLLKRAGYATGAFGKWHLGTSPHMHPLSRGFDTFYGFLGGQHPYLPGSAPKGSARSILRGREPVTEGEYLTDAIAREAAAFISAHKNRPFFAYVAFNAVHDPLQATAEYLERFPETGDPEVRTYQAMVSALDDAVGRLTATLAEHGLAERTLVVFLNDNGAPFHAREPEDPVARSNGPLRDGKPSLYEGGVRVPMILRWPGVVKPGAVFRGPTSALDVVPTIAAAAGLRLPPDLELDGVDLRPHLTGKAEGAPHQVLYWTWDVFSAMRRDDWKVVRTLDEVLQLDEVSLFDLSKDVGETQDLSGQHPELTEELAAELQRWRASMPPPAWTLP